jgi:trk system potassium uptake protein TrkA
VTQSDQTNLVACKVAHSVFNVPRASPGCARATSWTAKNCCRQTNFAVDYALCPEQVITEYIARLIDFPEALQVLSFGGDAWRWSPFAPTPAGCWSAARSRNAQPSATRDRRPIAAIYRRDGAITPTGETIIEDGDEVFLLAAEEHIRTVMRELRRSVEPVRRVMIAGGGNIGLRVAQALESKCEVKLIEVDRRRAEFVATTLKSVLVLCGDATDEELLQQEASTRWTSSSR